MDCYVVVIQVPAYFLLSGYFLLIVKPRTLEIIDVTDKVKLDIYYTMHHEEYNYFYTKAQIKRIKDYVKDTGMRAFYLNMGKNFNPFTDI